MIYARFCFPQNCTWLADPRWGVCSAPETRRSAAHENVGGARAARPRRQHSRWVIGGKIRKRLKTPALVVRYCYIWGMTGCRGVFSCVSRPADGSQPIRGGRCTWRGVTSWPTVISASTAGALTLSRYCPDRAAVTLINVYVTLKMHRYELDYSKSERNKECNNND